MSEDKQRLNLVLPMQTINRLERIKDKTLAASTTEVIKAAILTYEALVEFLADGNKFYVCKPGDNKFNQVHFLIDVEPK